jgi:predicted nucleic acid-binding protein
MIYIDTSVIINSFFTTEKNSRNSKELMRRIKEGEYTASTSEFTLIEVASAVSRVTGDAKLAREVVKELELYPNVTIIPTSRILLDKAFDIAADHGLRAGDAIQTACAILEGADYLIQRDSDFRRIKDLIKIAEPEDLLKK